MLKATPAEAAQRIAAQAARLRPILLVASAVDVDVDVVDDEEESFFGNSRAKTPAAIPTRISLSNHFLTPIK